MENLQILLELKEEFHRMNLNIERLLERDKVQNKRIDKLEEEIKSLREKTDTTNNFMNKAIGVISFIILSIPVILKFIK